MGTPKVLPKEHAYAPVKYDVEDGGVGGMSLLAKDRKNLGISPEDDQKVQLKDWDDDEDKQILESIKFAENKLGAKMGTPKVLPKEHAFAPVKYDVEELS